MKKLKLITDGKEIATIKQLMLFVGVVLTILPVLMLSWGGLSAAPAHVQIQQHVFSIGIYVLMTFLLMMILFSQYSPIKCLSVRKKLILFTRLFIKPRMDGMLYHSVTWRYAVKGKTVVIDLYPEGLVRDTGETGQKLAEYMGETLLKYEESDNKARYIFGEAPKRYDGMNLLKEGISEWNGRYVPMVSYESIPIYGDVNWDFTSEALHILLLAPSGSGKTMFLSYLGGMILKRQHKLYVIDAKNSSFGALFRYAGVRVATNTEEIIKMLTALVQKMEEIYAEYFATGRAGIDANFSTLNLKGHFLIFDEILSVLNSADKKEKAEIERLLSQLALKGRAAGFSLVITAQKLNATDLPKAITEQCQTRIILGKLVSDETFHQATGLYKKDAITTYKGGVGKGYAVMPQIGGLTYIKTPFLPKRAEDMMKLFSELRNRGVTYGEDD